LEKSTSGQEWSCNKCKDSGYEFLDDRTVRECECQIEVKNRLRLEKSGLQEVIDKYTFETYETKEKYQNSLKAKAQNYVKEIESGEKTWWFIGGQSGIGKTHLCTAICSELMKQKKSLKYVIANKVIMELKSTVMNQVDYFRIMGQLINVDVLYIDDLFKSKSITDADVKALFEIINDRYTQNKITIVSSEKTIFDLEEHGELEAITGRIVEKAKSYVINIKKDSSKNYRKQNYLNL
jgi:DNA replication protein DnaC